MVTPWVKHSPQRAMNRKLRAAGFAARGLDDAAICQVAADDSDGHISEATVETLAVAHGEKRWRKLVDVLVKVGRWDPDGDGWSIHDYEEFNLTKAHWEEFLAKKRGAGKLGGRPPKKPYGLANGSADGLAGAEADAEPASLRLVSIPTSSSAAAHDSPGERPDDDGLLRRALEVVAERRMAKVKHVKNPPGLRHSLLVGLPRELADRIADTPVGDFQTAEQLADWLEPPVRQPLEHPSEAEQVSQRAAFNEAQAAAAKSCDVCDEWGLLLDGGVLTKCSHPESRTA